MVSRIIHAPDPLPSHFLTQETINEWVKNDLKIHAKKYVAEYKIKRSMMHPDPSRPIRTFVKAFGWECFSFLLTLLVSWLVVGDIGKASTLTGILFVLKVLFLFLYERAWHRVRWGKRYR